MLEGEFLVFVFEGVQLLEFVFEGVQLLEVHFVLVLRFEDVGLVGLLLCLELFLFLDELFIFQL